MRRAYPLGADHRARVRPLCHLGWCRVADAENSPTARMPQRRISLLDNNVAQQSEIWCEMPCSADQLVRIQSNSVERRSPLRIGCGFAGEPFAPRTIRSLDGSQPASS